MQIDATDFVVSINLVTALQLSLVLTLALSNRESIDVKILVAMDSKCQINKKGNRSFNIFVRHIKHMHWLSPQIRCYIRDQHISIMCP